MAIIQCDECEHDISDSAVSCPKCGITNQGRPRNWFESNGELLGMTIVLVATGLQVFFVDKLRNTQSDAEFIQIDHKLNHLFWALTSGDPSNYPTMSKSNFDVFDYIGTDLWLNDLFGIISGVLFICGSMMILGAKFLDR